MVAGDDVNKLHYKYQEGKKLEDDEIRGKL